MRRCFAHIFFASLLLSACTARYAGPAADEPDGGSDDAATIDGDASAAVTSKADAAAACVPLADAGFSPTWEPPRTPLDVCSEDQIEAAEKACFGSQAASFLCNDFHKQNEPCAECLVTTYVHLTYGPIVVIHNGTYEANIAGCIALVDGDTSATSCGAKYQALTECEDTLCGACDLSTSEGFDLYVKCLDRAEDTTCRPYKTAASCANDPHYATCFAKSFDAYVQNLGRIFCNASAARRDAGLDATPDVTTGDDADVGDAGSD